MTSPRRTVAANFPAVGSLLFTNFTYALIQYNVAALFGFMLADYPSEGVTGLGVLTAAFFLGIGAFEIPGSILAARIGTKNAVLIGTLASGVAMVLSGYVRDFGTLAALRFVTGLGTGVGFPPLVVKLSRTLGGRRSGFALGLVNVSYNLGGILGLFGSAVLGLAVGWRDSMIASGVVILAAAALALLFVKEEEEEDALAVGERNRVSSGAGFVSGLRAIFVDRWIGVLSLSLFGIGATAALTWNFVVFYMEVRLLVRPEVAGLVGSFNNVFAVFTAPFVGRAYDRLGKRQKSTLLVSGALIMSVGVAVTADGTFLSAALSTALVGIATAFAWTVGLAAAKEASSHNPRMENVAVGVVDSVSLLGSFFSPVLFSALVISFGYRFAWLVGSLFAILFSVPLMLYDRKKGVGREVAT